MGRPTAWTRQNGQWRVAGPTLEAFIGPDGCLNALQPPFAGEYWTRVPNVLKPGLGLPVESGTGGSRGAFFFQNGEILRLADVKPVDATTLTGQSDKATARYAFSTGNLTWTLTSRTDQPMQFLMVLDPTVNAVRNDDGTWKKTPVNELRTTVVWFQGQRRRDRSPRRSPGGMMSDQPHQHGGHDPDGIEPAGHLLALVVPGAEVVVATREDQHGHASIFVDSGRRTVNVGFNTFVRLAITVVPSGWVAAMDFSLPTEPASPGGFPGQTSREVRVMSARPGAVKQRAIARPTQMPPVLMAASPCPG